ncbi:hypothetical protein [Phytomonospora endophytica]|uniref:Uncharacterized protein n=1 Tax=Phytomonospora endophytica TaxID=714109 RepID=A0A841FCF2_9ACTN|nr:hypothetical protein [Phytomonospora endophytica]MBB6033075.1 hypothetical protein [Phytomonospora endophytica]GIG65302.1 hypothetical protein Pen01_15970 [Phytomonospora endophytica]
MKLVTVLNSVTDKILDRLVGEATAEAGVVYCRCVYNPVVCAKTGGAELLCHKPGGKEYFAGCGCP